MITDLTPSLYMRHEGYEYYLIGGGNDVTLIQKNMTTRLVEQRANCLSEKHAKTTADKWARDVALSKGPW